MAEHRKNYGKKLVSDKRYFFNSIPFEPIIKIIFDEEYYVTNENILIVKSDKVCTINLNDNSSDNVTIKSFTKTVIKSTTKIDEYYDEIEIGNGSCVELQKIENKWYVLSSDGIKSNS